MQTLPNTYTVQAKAIITFDLSLFSKFGGVTMLEFGRRTTASDDPEGCQWTESDLHIETSFDNSHA